ncbi:hypothetical protein O0L34_g10756 [Tuta absoluta]|nr:hypothetical protein O0L34_g10756 [Tuta absoluta]
MKGLALAIYKKSPRVYRYLKQLITLPSERTLQTILQKLPMEPGWNDMVFRYLEKNSGKLSEKEKICVILFDEMSLKKRVFYNPRTDKIEGYVDLGSAGRTSNVADKVLVFMLQGVYKKIKQPLGHFFVKGSRIRLSNVRCTNGYYITLSSLQDIWMEVSKVGFKYLNLRQLNQDALENLFGIIRQHCPTNQNPTCHHFTAALKSTILTRLNTPLKGSNCEKDQNDLILDFHDVVFKNAEAEDALEAEHQYNAPMFMEEETEDNVTLHIPEIEDVILDAQIFASFEKQPLVYVSGYIACAVIRRIHVTCAACLNSLRTNLPGEEEMYRYIALNEWYNKKSLTYPTIKLCKMIEDMVKVFEEEIRPILHISDIGKNCRLAMLRAIDLSWLCTTHWTEIADQLVMQVSLLLLRNDCKKINRTFSEKEESCADYNKKAQVMGIRK